VMTGYTYMDIAVQIAAALNGDWGDERFEIAAALEPVVQEISLLRAAEELEAAAENFHLNISGKAQLRARAAVLRSEAGQRP
jgi:hypothetical protein